MGKSNTVLLLPSLNPDESLPNLVKKMQKAGFYQIVVIDDGSGPEYADLFKGLEQAGCIVVHHDRNLGKGAALKTGIRNAIEYYGENNAYITADADGQHLSEDIRRVAEALEQYPDKLILGVRDFSSENVPFRSLFGNRITSLVFRLSTGISCPDTQTGLRGIPVCLEKLALSEEGERYEYEMNFLSNAVKYVSLQFVPIQTVYENGNRVSHFRPVRDSFRVYGKILRFAGASLAGAVTDYLLFYLFSIFLALPQLQMIFLATALARIGSGTVNFLLNRYWSFQSKMPAGKEAFRYSILFISLLCASAGLVALFSRLPIPVLLVKIIVDTTLFFFSYHIQKNWVFRREADR